MLSIFFTPAAASHQVAFSAGAPVASPNDLALIAVLTFLALVIQREVIGPTARGRGDDLARGLNIGIAPLGLAFCIIVGARLLQMF